MGLSSRLKTLREQKNLSQRKLAKILNMAPSTLAMYETSKRAPDYDTLIKIAEYFEITTDFLLGRTDDPAPPAAPQKPSYEEMVLSAKTMGDASVIIFNLHSADKIDNDEFICLMKTAYKHLGLPPVKGAEEAAHLEHNIPGTGVFEKRSDDKDKS